MARTGLYKSQVKKARDALLLQNKHPSVDAVRIELGNTGSKTTIHKYLKELEEDDEDLPLRLPPGEVLQDLVTRLAAQLQTEADAQISMVKSEAAEEATRLAAEIDALRQTNSGIAVRLAQSQTDASVERAAHRLTASQLQEQSAARHAVELQIAVLKERLEGNEQHRRIMEKQHQSVLETLEHDRAASKEQRDEDIRRHGQHIHTLQNEIGNLRQDAAAQQEEIMRSTQECVRLTSDLSHLRQTHDEQKMTAGQLRQKLEKISEVLQQKEVLEAQIANKNLLIEQLQSQIADRVAATEALRDQLQHCQIELAATVARLEAQQSLSRELRTYVPRSKKTVNK